MDSGLTMHEALLLAVRHQGGQSQTARNRGVTQPTVHYWLNVMKKCPPEHVIGMEEDGGVSRHLLRPDIYPMEEVPTPPQALPLIPAPSPQSPLVPANENGVQS